jgi:hypothetical protein
MAQYVPGFRDGEAEIVTLTLDSPPGGGKIWLPRALKDRLLGVEINDSESAKPRVRGPWCVV